MMLRIKVSITITSDNSVIDIWLMKWHVWMLQQTKVLAPMDMLLKRVTKINTLTAKLAKKGITL